MYRFFKSVANTSRSVLHETGVVCSASAIAYGVNGIMTSLFTEAKAKIRPYVPVEWNENDNENAPCKTVMIRTTGPK